MRPLMGITIALDCMGGDHGAHVTVPAAASFLAHNPEASVVLVGAGKSSLRAEMKRASLRPNLRVRVQHASEVVAMDEAVSRWPCVASATRPCAVAIDLVKSGEADACVSAGNTGALMADLTFRAQDAARSGAPGDRIR